MKTLDVAFTVPRDDAAGDAAPLPLPDRRAPRPFTEADNATIRARWAKGIGPTGIGRELDREPCAISRHARDVLGLPSLARGYPWQPHEIAYLRKHYARLGPLKCAAALGRGAGTVSDKAIRLGLVDRSELPDLDPEPLAACPFCGSTAFDDHAACYTCGRKTTAPGRAPTPDQIARRALAIPRRPKIERRKPRVPTHSERTVPARALYLLT